MTRVVSAEFYALYKFKKILESCAQAAYAVQDDAEDLSLPRTALPNLENAKKLHAAWKEAHKARKREAAAMHKELEAAAKALRSVAELYGWTDAELGRQIQQAEKYW